jgi:cytochrome c553
MASQTPPDPSKNEAFDRSFRRWAWIAIGSFTLVSLILGLIVLPSRDQPGFDPVAIICRAIGIPGYQTAQPNPPAPAAPPVSDVAWSSESRRLLARASPQRGGELVRQSCAACHGQNGISTDPDDFPNLAGQYGAVIFKQLRDFQTSARKSMIMESIAKPLSEAQMMDIAAYFAALPHTGSVVSPDAVNLNIRLLAVTGDPVRANAACDACHGDSRSGPEEAPFLAGQTAPYLERQLKNFAGAERSNDLFERMRAIARQLTPDEMHLLALYYGGTPAPH